MSGIVGVAEAAKILGVTPQRIVQLYRTPIFPRPVAVLAATPVWDESEVRAFALTRNRKSGPRPKAGA